jgi:photosystem II stability/assembly factor-like uncharacterized protein
MTKNKLLLPLILIFALLLSGCITFSGKKEDAPPPIPLDGGFYALSKTKEGDYTWLHKTYLATTSPQKPNFKGVDVLVMKKDPQDDKAIYIGTKEHGMYYTYDAGQNWFTVEKFRKSKINDIAISYKNKCLIYVVAGSQLYKSTDCNRTWTRMYNEDRDGFYISSLAVDSYNEGTIYAGLSIDTQNKKAKKDSSDLIKSVDFAESWQVVKRTPVGSMVSKILINPKDTRIVYLATHNSGIFKSINGGGSWQDITGEKQELAKTKQEKETFIQRFEKLIDFATDIKSKKIRESLVFRDMAIILDEDENDSLIHASNYGILKSTDGGHSWNQVELIPPKGEEKAIIYSLAIHPEDGDEFYYGTDDTLFRTTDGGENWTTIKGPGTRAIYDIVVTPNIGNETNVYIGMYNLISNQ